MTHSVCDARETKAEGKQGAYRLNGYHDDSVTRNLQVARTILRSTPVSTDRETWLGAVQEDPGLWLSTC